MLAGERFLLGRMILDIVEIYGLKCTAKGSGQQNCEWVGKLSIVMEMNSEFYKTELGQKVVSVIITTSKMLIDRCYERIPADNIKTDLTEGWISSMDEMLDCYSATLLPWAPNVGKAPSVTVETADGFVVDAPLFHEENGTAVSGDIHMIFDFGYDGRVDFEGIHY